MKQYFDSNTDAGKVANARDRAVVLQHEYENSGVAQRAAAESLWLEALRAYEQLALEVNARTFQS